MSVVGHPIEDSGLYAGHAVSLGDCYVFYTKRSDLKELDGRRFKTLAEIYRSIEAFAQSRAQELLPEGSKRFSQSDASRPLYMSPSSNCAVRARASHVFGKGLRSDPRRVMGEKPTPRTNPLPKRET